MLISEYCYDYKDFIKKYNFTHFVLNKGSCLYNNLKKDNYNLIYEDKFYAIFEAKDDRIDNLKLK